MKKTLNKIKILNIKLNISIFCVSAFSREMDKTIELKSQKLNPNAHFVAIVSAGDHKLWLFLR